MLSRGSIAAALVVAVVACCQPASAVIRRMGPWNPAAGSDLIVVGRIQRATDVDVQSQDRVSSLRLNRVLYGDAAVGDTLQVYWRFPGTMTDDGLILVVEGAGPDLDAFADRPAVWLLRCCHEGWLYLHRRPVVLERGQRPRIEKLIEELGEQVDDPLAMEAARALSSYLQGFVDGASLSR